MSDLEILVRLILVLGFGAVLGLETETRVSQAGEDPNSPKVQAILRERLGGVRTYTVLALFGAIGGILFAQGYPVYSYLIFASVMVIVLAAYVLNIQKNQAFGMTTEIAILTTVVIGFAALADLVPLQILVVILISLAFVLSQKRGTGLLVKSIDHNELEDIIKFAIVTVVFLPFLPDQNIYLYELPILQDLFGSLFGPQTQLGNFVFLNPFRVWIYVVLISGFNLIGYFANRVVGSERGLLLTGVFGGFASSTSTTIALSIKSKGKQGYIGMNYGGIGLIANATSFLQIFVLALSASVAFASHILLISVVMLMTSTVIGAYFIYRTNQRIASSPKVSHEPFSIVPAIKFAALLVLVRIAVQVAELLFGSGGFVAAISLSGFVGMDIATITLGELVALDALDLRLAVVTFVLANLVNFFAKTVYSALDGSRAYLKVISLGMIVTSLAAIVVTLLSYIFF